MHNPVCVWINTFSLLGVNELIRFHPRVVGMYLCEGILLKCFVSLSWCCLMAFVIQSLLGLSGDPDVARTCWMYLLIDELRHQNCFQMQYKVIIFSGLVLTGCIGWMNWGSNENSDFVLSWQYCRTWPSQNLRSRKVIAFPACFLPSCLTVCYILPNCVNVSIAWLLGRWNTGCLTNSCNCS